MFLYVKCVAMQVGDIKSAVRQATFLVVEG